MKRRLFSVDYKEPINVWTLALGAIVGVSIMRYYDAQQTLKALAASKAVSDAAKAAGGSTTV